MIYLDAAATTPIRPEVLAAMRPWMTAAYGNPSSSHQLGEQAAQAIRQARERIAAILNCRSAEIIFTSGGTESDNLAVKGIALANPRGRHIVTSAIEHEAVLESCDYLERLHGFRITRLPVDSTGLVSLAAFEQALTPGTALASIMSANNEVGTIQPIAELARIAARHGIPLHADAVQIPATSRIDTASPAVSSVTLSGHKVGAPKGIGLLYLRARIPLEPLIHGGGQQRNRRSGTENPSAIIALATALELAHAEVPTRALACTQARDHLIHAVLEAVPSAILTGHPTQRLPNHASFCFPGTAGEAVLLALQERGILCSSGSACAAGRSEPSPVLLAMGYPPEVAQTALRLSFTDAPTPATIADIVQALRASIASLPSA